MLVKILVWLLNKAFESNKRSELEPCIKALYRRMAQKNLGIRTEIIKVKKGKRRYDLAFFETPEGKIRLHIGRHWGHRGLFEFGENKVYSVVDQENNLIQMS